MRKWIAARYAGYTAGGKFWLTIGAACLMVDMAIGYLAGVAVGTFWHGVGYAALAAGFAFLPDAAYEEYEHKRIASAAVMAALCVPIGVKAYEQQLTYSTGVRQGEMQVVNVHNTKYTGAQDDVVRVKNELAVLMAAQKSMVEKDQWAGSVKADGLRAQVADLRKAEASETRLGGCKAKCRAIQNKIADVQEQIAKAEKFETNEARIAELQRMIDAKREKADKTEHKQSINADIAKTTAALFNLVRGAKPEDAINADDTQIQYATLGSAGLGSLALLILAPVGFFLAGRRRKPEEEDTTPPTGAVPVYHAPAPPRPAAPQSTALVPQPHRDPIVVHMKEQLTDEAFQKIRDGISRAIGRPATA